MACPLKPKKPSRLRFGLKAVFAFALVCGLACSWVTSLRRFYEKQHEARLAIEHAGGIAEEEPAAPAWLGALIGRDFYYIVTEVHFQYSDVEPYHGTHYLRQLSELRKLWMQPNSVRDADLQCLEGLTELEELEISFSLVTDDGLRHLAGLKKLQRLDLTAAQVTDHGIKHLRGLTSLRDLDLDETPVSDAGLRYLSELENLERLNLINTHVSGSCFCSFASRDKLTELHLDGTRMSDSGVACLQQFSSMRYLNLDRTKVTEKGALQIGNMKTLETLIVPDASSDTIRSLQQRLPECTIY
jgi:hypothetical protein